MCGHTTLAAACPGIAQRPAVEPISGLPTQRADVTAQQR
jgi:hypothetical protein